MYLIKETKHVYILIFMFFSSVQDSTCNHFIAFVILQKTGCQQANYFKMQYDC